MKLFLIKKLSLLVLSLVFAFLHSNAKASWLSNPFVSVGATTSGQVNFSNKGLAVTSAIQIHNFIYLSVGYQLLNARYGTLKASSNAYTEDNPPSDAGVELSRSRDDSDEWSAKLLQIGVIADQPLFSSKSDFYHTARFHMGHMTAHDSKNNLNFRGLSTSLQTGFGYKLLSNFCIEAIGDYTWTKALNTTDGDLSKENRALPLDLLGLQIALRWDFF